MNLSDYKYIALFLVFYLVLVNIYFLVAVKYKVIDRPNHRSSHSKIAIRGAGIIFPISFIVSFFFTNGEFLWQFVCSLLSVSVISFIDDIRSISSKIRFTVQMLSTVFFIYSTYADLSIVLLVVSVLVIIFSINAYNFMDGINGITALYSLVTLSTLYWISENITSILPSVFFISLLCSVCVFAFYNVRFSAKCFSGDVGSISIAFVICLFLFLLIIKTNFSGWAFFLGVYSIDTSITIFFRILRKENIMDAHRSHFYQYLVNEKKMSHITVSTIYAIAQLILNGIVLISYQQMKSDIAVIGIFVYIIIYIIFRVRMEGWRRLIVTYS